MSTIKEIMAERRNESIKQIKSALWNSETEKAIEIAIAGGITGSEIEKIQTEIDTIKADIEEGNSIDLAALKKAVTAAEKIEAAQLAKLEEAQEAYGDAFRQAQAARDTLGAANSKVHKMAAMMEGGQVPAGIEPSESVKQVMASNATLAATDKRCIELKASILRLRNSIDRIEIQLSGAATSLSREGSFDRDVATLEQRLAGFKKEHAAAVAELAKLG
jgi:hypothetical protein